MTRRSKSNLQATSPATRARALEALRVNVIVGRARAKLSQDELALRAAVSRPTISRIERTAGDIGIEVAQRIGDALGVSVAELLTLPNTAVEAAQLEGRARASDDEFIEAQAPLAALAETAEHPIGRYSRAGRPRLAQ